MAVEDPHAQQRQMNQLLAQMGQPVNDNLPPVPKPIKPKSKFIKDREYRKLLRKLNKLDNPEVLESKVLLSKAREMASDRRSSANKEIMNKKLGKTGEEGEKPSGMPDFAALMGGGQQSQNAGEKKGFLQSLLQGGKEYNN